MAVLSDGDSFIAAVVGHATEQELHNLQNNTLLQLLTWRLSVRNGHTMVVVSALKYVTAYRGIIGQPEQVVA